MSQPDISRVKFCACGNLRRATRELTQYYDEILQPSGIRITQFTFLVNLARAGALTVTQLAEKLVMDQTTVTHNLHILEKDGLVERKTGHDKRTRIITITPQGQQALVKAIPLWEQAQAQIVSGFGQERLHHVLTEVSAMVAFTR